MTTDEQTLIYGLAGPAILSARSLFLAALPADLRVAVLVEIAGAAANLARSAALSGHVDPAAIAAVVTDPVDVKPVLGRGMWLPTMVRHVARPTLSTDRLPGTSRRSTRDAEQLALFASLPAKEL